MIEPVIITTYAALLLAALAGSLHCIGMCGPILLAFSGAMARGSDGDGDGRQQHSSRIAWGFAWYHVGRIWTYGMLGLLAGFVGCCVRHSSSLATWQRAVGLALGALVVLVGLALLGLIPGLRLDKSGTCGMKKVWGMPALRSLLRTNSIAARLLLGAIMGLLPCGLVYAMLAIVASLPTPGHAALGMVIFGIGTIPSLTTALVTAQFIPVRWRGAGTRLSALMVIATGAWITVRSVIDLCAGHGS